MKDINKHKLIWSTGAKQRPSYMLRLVSQIGRYSHTLSKLSNSNGCWVLTALVHDSHASFESIFYLPATGQSLCEALAELVKQAEECHPGMVIHTYDIRLDVSRSNLIDTS